jgi:lipopolysaccharide/colanic/teichoic acid biosynthesis glycosyltransferase
MIRFIDFLFSFSALICLSPILVILLVIGRFQNGSPLFLQQRVGCRQKLFFLIKFRTLPIGTKSVPTHLLDQTMITPYGKFLRSSKLDELPQLFNVLRGDMSIVGPRPCLVTQRELIKERMKRKVFNIKPGITGIAQVNGIDMKNPKLLAKIDLEMVKKMNLCLYFYYILKTLILFLRSCFRLKF